jgi:hypothetical protein
LFLMCDKNNYPIKHPKKYKKQDLLHIKIKRAFTFLCHHQKK